MNLLSHLASTIINTDSYKVSHWSQYPEGTEYVSSYIEARNSKYAKELGPEYDFAEFFGLQAFIKDYLAKPIEQDDIDLAELLYEMHGEPFNKEGWQYILDKHDGKLPVEIRALPEGTVAKTSNAMAEIINTDPKCYWLTSYVETALLRAVWYPTTVATKSRILKEITRDFMEGTSDEPAAAIDFMLQDFGARGVSSMESSGLGGMAHIVNYKGTDTVMGLVASLGYYNKDFDKFLEETPDKPKRAMIKLLKKMKEEGTPLPAFSVEASEHSTMTIQGREGEKEQIKRLIDKAKEGRIVSIVSDSYDHFHNVMNVFGDEFKEDILEAGRKGGRVVIRPDSGDPVDVIVKTLEILDEKFGTTVNSKGYKVLPPAVRVLQGDGIDMDSMRDILQAVKDKGFSAENLVFGMGGGLEQKVNRDDLSFAQKASAACIKGKWYDVFKDPATSSAKQSKKGRLATIWDGVAFKTIRHAKLKSGQKDQMQVVFRNGEAKNMQTWDNVCSIAEYFTNLIRKPPTTPVPDPWAKATAKPQGMAA
ncbi:MAG: nicotinate phosphoribosyltransferase [Alphaproteobacteria bacterium]|nr:nicotinate phosphoribosyltransferase [Alphaproteobacteria bacterium]